MNTVDVIGIVFLVLGGFTMLVGAVGVVRFPDFYSRLHAAGKGDTLGQGLIVAGLILITLSDGGSWNDLLKLILIAFFVFVFNATATHALARAAWIAGLKPFLSSMHDEPVEFEQAEGQLTDAGRDGVFVPVQPAAKRADRATGDAEGPARPDGAPGEEAS